MKKTFCDVCEEQCINTTITMRAVMVHHTSDGKFAGEDEYKEVEICLDCFNKIKERVPKAFILIHREFVDEEARMSPSITEAPVRVESTGRG